MKWSAYRTAMKLRCIQKAAKCKLIKYCGAFLSVQWRALSFLNYSSKRSDMAHFVVDLMLLREET